jgi:hypothetical protein
MPCFGSFSYALLSCIGTVCNFTTVKIGNIPINWKLTSENINTRASFKISIQEVLIVVFLETINSKKAKLH